MAEEKLSRLRVVMEGSHIKDRRVERHASMETKAQGEPEERHHHCRSNRRTCRLHLIAHRRGFFFSNEQTSCDFLLNSQNVTRDRRDEFQHVVYGRSFAVYG
jgi:hypothetical protein